MTQGKWTPTVPSDSAPKYLALATSIEEAIESGALQPDERLPTNRELSQLFGVTIATVTKAMAVAARKGLIVAQVGSGTFVRGVSPGTTNAQALDLSLNILPDNVVAKELVSLVQPQSPASLAQTMFGYGTYVPTASHADRAVAWMSTFGAHGQASNTLLTVGVHQGLMAAFHVLLSPGQSALCEDVTYTGIKRIASYRDVTLLGVRCDEGGMVPESLAERLEQSAAKVVVVTSTLHNPTTATLSPARREAIARLCRQYDAYLIEDGINMPLVGGPEPSVASFAPERSIFLTGYSKCVSSGFRLGYAVVPPVLFDAFHEALVSTQWIGPRLYADLAEQMLASDLIGDLARAHRHEARVRYERATRILKGIRPATKPGYHAWVDAPSGPVGENIAMHALRLGVKVSPAAHFAVAPDVSVSAASYRISLGACQSMADLERALTILAGIEGQYQSTVSTLI